MSRITVTIYGVNPSEQGLFYQARKDVGNLVHSRKKVQLNQIETVFHKQRPPCPFTGDFTIIITLPPDKGFWARRNTNKMQEEMIALLYKYFSSEHRHDWKIYLFTEVHALHT